MDLGLKDKRALVLGGNRGLGRAIAEALAAEGARVAIAARPSETLDEAGKALGTATIAADLADAAAPRLIAERAQALLGGVDILVNNGGGPPPTGALGVPREQWVSQFQTMVASLIELTELVLPGMRERGWGRILTITSSGVIQPIKTLGMSNTLRVALVNWSKTLAGEVAADGVTVNILVPGRIATERLQRLDKAAAERQNKSQEEVSKASQAQVPVGRYGDPREFGDVAAFLASTRASYVTGSVIRIDGGLISSV